MPDRKRFRNEGELRDFIKNELEKQKYEVESEVRLEGVQVDLYAKKGNEFSVIEVKYRNLRGIPDDIGKCVRLSHSPDVDRTYVAAPAFVLPEDYVEMAKEAGVGVYTVTEDGVAKELESNVRSQANLLLAWNQPDVVYVGEDFTIGIRVRNYGERVARDVELKHIPSHPFRRPRGARSRRLYKELGSQARHGIPL